ncbi:MAG: hypothetical protein ACI8PZ_003683 [Myxococcota bacterium]|jgi:hypothetical protein
MRWVSVVWILLACGVEPDAVPTESDALGQSIGAGEWALAGGHRIVADASGLRIEGPSAQVLSGELLGAPAVAPNGRFVFSERVGEARLRAVQRDGTEWAVHTVVAAGDPGRAAISNDGDTIAYVASAGGLPAVFVVPFSGGEPVQLTNVGVSHDPSRGGPPPGFVPPPHEAPLAFEGDTVTWTAPDGRHTVEVP